MDTDTTVTSVNLFQHLMYVMWKESYVSNGWLPGKYIVRHLLCSKCKILFEILCKLLPPKSGCGIELYTVDPR